MKTKYFILAVLAGLTFASCSNDDFASENNQTLVSQPSDGTINFGFSAPAMTRADLYGGDAAAKLGNKFVVYGTKHVAAEDNTETNDKVVFNNFQVAYTASTAGTTASNTSDWEYAGLQAYDATPTQQGVKYWDFSAKQGYTFYAFSSSDISYPKNDADKVKITKVTKDEPTAPAKGSLYNKGYSVEVSSDANLGNLYFSDRVPVAKDNYEKTVNLTFRNIGTKVRFGFYETVPGYTVKIDKFYIDEDASATATPATAPVTSFAQMNNPKTDGFYASLQNVKGSANQTINVTYYDNTDATVENRPKVSNPTGGYDYNIKLGSATTIINKVLSTSASAPTWVDGSTSGDYTFVYPFEGNTNPLLLKLDFTLTAEDGSPDVIHVRGARAIVPAESVKWKGNFAYTYIFKISDKTNGTTGDVDENGDPTDPVGLKPITFDAVVVDVTEERQEVITSVSTNSITTYAEGKIVNEYKAGEPIYVAVTDDATHSVITPSGIGDTDGKAQVYKLGKAATEAEVFAQLTGSPIGLAMTAVSGASVETTVPLADKTTPAIANVKFTPATADYYAYVYTTTKYVAPTYELQSSGTYDSSETYYLKSGSGAYFAVPVTSEASFNANKSKLYLQTAPGTAGVYDVKVIKVQ